MNEKRRIAKQQGVCLRVYVAVEEAEADQEEAKCQTQNEKVIAGRATLLP